MPKNIRKIAAFAVTILTAFVITACGGGSNSRNTDRLVVGQNADANSLDLHRANDVNSSLVTGQIFETLVIQTPEMELIPGLATDWHLLEDGLTWEFNLREGVTFHNGEAFTADDVKFTFQRAANFPQIDVILGMIDSENIEIVSDYVIHIPTYEPFAPFLRNLAHPAAAIMNRVAVTAAEEISEAEVSENPVGTGPFEFVRWSTG